MELPPLRDHFKHEDSLPPFSPPRPRKDFLLPSILSHSPPPRSSTLPPIHRKDRLPRPRKSSITQNARKPKHDRPRRPSLGERKALSAEPQTAAWAQGKRWEDLIEAATSATEADDDRSSEVCLASVSGLYIMLTDPARPVAYDPSAYRQYHLGPVGPAASLLAPSRLPSPASLAPTAVRCVAPTQVADPATANAPRSRLGSRALSIHRILARFGLERLRQELPGLS